jgi:hypothetical protein
MNLPEDLVNDGMNGKGDKRGTREKGKVIRRDKRDEGGTDKGGTKEAQRDQGGRKKGQGRIREGQGRDKGKKWNVGGSREKGSGKKSTLHRL